MKKRHQQQGDLAAARAMRERAEEEYLDALGLRFGEMLARMKFRRLDGGGDYDVTPERRARLMAVATLAKIFRNELMHGQRLFI